MTKGELERLAVLETQMENIFQKVDNTDKNVTNLDGKIDAILIHQAKGSGAVAFAVRVVPMLLSVSAIVAAVAIR